MSEDLKDIAREVHAILYSKRKDEQQNIIRTYYDTNAVLEEPIIFVKGQDEIIRQFFFTATIFISVTAEIYSITDSMIAGNHHIVSVDALIKYRLPLKPILFRQEIELRTITKWEFNGQNKIVRHEDIWSIKDLVETLPCVGWVYSYFGRKSVGLFIYQLAKNIRSCIGYDV
ncbi:hypothetical protein RhiirA5_131147 [Rhizophagus irregularis]|uniref:SigF-like NTF2-like domain-containing protein n=3 Tax=Rhizophagus irregularis TaxID=588596 RepID=A0A2I1EMU8_9GLOM|nr:hypothetical protein GLOIN_2v1875234 [Rhizophagus irregularis DAOM 181602=DAOM 197198]EXX55229.1 hypothetical protein RirG_227080 [Rhizophagus irregularis DAOM 197198w]PKC10858.1 hypothetical protein RhiirA5_131147 [Rhizophagus irregularis]PKC76079.1 hypothetical protein RhiirA1_528224 [Rhizophagus irregularis]PKK79767.1 hypothetical protein RhiirC2_842335 [Rhizophagus irregularis]PKY23443.1 hypothetical protein RhiirB3_526488 [Rhizophagus irregularis]|eukprot:XP_025179229.1 hypothetical protein GLOIN_2v1875234 [Rhizophagus irregularis DAOM 181602=DAOM 197198]